MNVLTDPSVQICFILVLVGITTVVGTFYRFIIPYLWTVQHPLVFSLYVLYGHYILVNVCYHYFRGVYTDPGSAPKVSSGLWPPNDLMIFVVFRMSLAALMSDPRTSGRAGPTAISVGGL